MGAGHGHKLHYHGHSVVHRAPAHLKLAGLVAFMLAVVATPIDRYAVFAGWAVLLLVWRLFDKPDVSDPSATVGIQWGMFGALLAAGALVAAGARVRASHRPEPPNPAADGWEEPPRRAPRRPDRRPADPAAVTEVLGERPGWSGEPPEPPSRR